jgi:hypothetical protein
MIMRHKIILLSTVVLVLVAGVLAGRLSAQLPLPVAVTSSGSGPRSWLTDSLGLNADQHQKMDAIWADAKRQLAGASESRHQLARDRDAAVEAILTDSQRSAYDKIQQDYHGQMDALGKQRQAVVDKANAASRALLDESQQQKWDLMTKQMREHHGNYTSSSAATTRPATGDSQ